ncbi:MAG: class I SAM-dependent methyltransferase [Chloroflexota bacterium]
MPLPNITSPKIDKYAAEHTSALPPLLDELVKATDDKFPDRSMMLCGQVEGQFLRMLVSMSGAKRVLEIGTFTGFSGLMMASGLPEGGEVITLELDPEHAAFARTFFARSEHGKKIKLIEGPALESLKSLSGPFDFAFIDANKDSYPDYYEATVPLMASGGLIAIDNALREGKVLKPKGLPSRRTAELNDKITKDDRVEHVMLTVRDGVMLARKK